MTTPDHREDPGLTVDEMAAHLKAAIARGFVGVSVTLMIRLDGRIKDNLSLFTKGRKLSDFGGDLTTPKKSRKVSM